MLDIKTDFQKRRSNSAISRTDQYQAQKSDLPSVPLECKLTNSLYLIC